MKVQHIVFSFLDNDRATLVLEPEWIRERLRLYERTTLKSILSQSYQDFRIWLICGNRNKDITSAYPLPQRVEKIYDKGKAALNELEADYIALTRIDSDDLMRKDAMQAVHDNIPLSSNERTCSIFRRNLVWDQINEFIGLHHKPSPPFYTHIYSKYLYKNWKYFEADHYCEHGKAGGRSSETVDLGDNHICVVYHPQNISDIRRKRKKAQFTEEQKLVLAERGCILTRDKKQILNLLRTYGVEKL